MTDPGPQRLSLEELARIHAEAAALVDLLEDPAVTRVCWNTFLLLDEIDRLASAFDDERESRQLALRFLDCERRWLAKLATRRSPTRSSH